MGDLKDNNYIKKENVWSQNASDIPEILILITYEKYLNFIISSLSVTIMTVFSVYLLHLMTNDNSLIYQNFISSNIVTNIKRHLISKQLTSGIYEFKVSNGNARKICGICSKLTTLKTPERGN